MATATRKKSGRKKKIIKRIITIVILLAIAGAIAFGLWKLFHQEKKQEALTQELYRGSITSQISGYGTTKALKSSDVKLQVETQIAEVYVTEAQNVLEGDPLFLLDATAAQKAVEDAQRLVTEQQAMLKSAQEGVTSAQEGVTSAQRAADDISEQIAEAQQGYAKLTTSAPFAGKLLECQMIKAGDELSAGAPVAKLVDDKTFRLELYFSYAYADQIKVGQTATVSIPALMASVSGTVAEVNMVTRISPEGSKLFQVVFNVPNAGVLAADMAASVTMTIGGEEAYPYESGVLAYSRTADLTIGASGKVTSVNLMNYLDVSAGATLVTVSGEQLDEQISDLNESYQDALDAVTRAEEAVPRAEEAVQEQEEKLAELQTKLEEAQAQLEDLTVYAPMSGQVLFLSHNTESTQEAGTVIATIADTSVMVVEARVDEMNIQSVQNGMMVDITQDTYEGTNFFAGTVDSISLVPQSENGVSYFPVTIRVESYDPSVTLMSGMNVQYSMVLSQSDGCLLAPIQAVQYTEMGTCLFVKADEKPENAIDFSAEENPSEDPGMDPGMQGGMGGGGSSVKVPDGFWAVPVEVGLSDTTNVEILSGAEEGMTVFVQYLTDTASSWEMAMG